MNIGLVGSTNVGKSTLFNRLIGQFRAIVTDIPGTTRDIIEHETLIDDIGKVTFLDSPGLFDFKEEEVLIKQIINHSDLILFVIDDSVGITAKEQHIYSYIIEKHKKNKTILIVNKIDIKHKEKEYDLAVNEYYNLGFENVIGISAKKQKNLVEVKDIITKIINAEVLKETTKEAEALVTSETQVQDNRIHMAIIGKPNAGKSTLLNALMKKTVSKVENIPGTTRDYIIGEFTMERKKYVVYDTAGIRKKGDIHGIEKIAFDKTLDMLKYKRPIILFMVDGIEGLSHRDMTLIQEINNLALPMILCINKIDLLDAKHQKLLVAKTKAMMDFAKYIQVFPISAKTQKGVKEIFTVLSTIKKEAEKRIDTSQLNDIIGKEFISRPPRFPKNKVCKILYITQIDINAPTFMAFVNHKTRANFAFKRRLENTMRSHFGFMGTPLVIRFKERQDSRIEKRQEEAEENEENSQNKKPQEVKKESYGHRNKKNETMRKSQKEKIRNLYTYNKMKYFKYIVWIIIAVGADMISKYFFYNLRYLSETTLIRPTFNTGISRSLPVPFMIIIAVSIIGIGAFVWLFINKKITGLIAILLIGGTIGNLIDRVFLGGVRDFININIFNFPIFNIADMMLSIGVGIRILRVILEKKK